MNVRVRERTYVCIEDFDNIPPPRTIADLGAGNALADVPIAPPEGGRPAVQRIGEHGRLLDGPAREYGEASAKRAGVVELAIGEDVARDAAELAEVGGAEELLEGDDVRLGARGGDAAGNLGDALGTELGDLLQAPDVEGYDVYLAGEGVVHGGRRTAEGLRLGGG